MKKISLILISTFIIATIIASIAVAYDWNHIIGGGLNGTTGVPIKVGSDGTLYIRN